MDLLLSASEALGLAVDLVLDVEADAFGFPFAFGLADAFALEAGVDLASSAAPSMHAAGRFNALASDLLSVAIDYRERHESCTITLGSRNQTFVVDK